MQLQRGGSLSLPSPPQEATERLDASVGLAACAPAPAETPPAVAAAADSGGGGMDVEDAGAAAGEAALEDARSRILSAMMLADTILDVATADALRPPPSATSARLFNAVLTVLEGRVAVGERGARCAAVALGLVSSLALVLDGVAAEDQAPQPSLRVHERLPRVRAVLLDRLAPAPAAEDPDLHEFVDDAARLAGSAALDVCRALGSDAGQLVHECVVVCAAAAAQHDAPLAARLRAATTLGLFAVSERPTTAPLVPQCLEALVALAGTLPNAARSPGAGKGDEEDADDDKDGGSDEDEDEDEEEALDTRARSRLCVLRACRRLVDCACGSSDGADAPALAPAALLAPLLAPVVAVAEAWSAGPAAFFDYVDEVEVDDDGEDEAEAVADPSISVVAAAVMALLAALARCVGPADLRPYAGVDTPWVVSLFERAGRHKSQAVRRLAAATRKALAA